MKKLFLISFIFLAACSKQDAEFWRVANEQIAQGYKWKQIPCRAPKEGLPNLAIETPIGNKYVCNKLVK